MKYKLSEIMDIIGGGTPKTSKPEYWNGDIPWLSVKDFNNDYRYVYETEKTITQAGLDNSSTKLLKRNDSIISARGTVGEMAMIPYPMAFNQSCYGLRAKEGLVDEEYLYYLIKHNVVVLKKNTHGSVFDTITRDTFDDIEVELPSLVEQEIVASILQDLDDKIEVNNEINNNLEQQAQAIFDDMFPDIFSLNTDATLQDLIVFANGKKRPKTIGNIPVYGGNGILAYTDKSNADNCVIIGRVGAYCGNTFLCLDKCWTSDNAIQAKNRTGSSPLFIYYLLRNASLSSRHIGTGQPLMTQGILNAIPIKYPVEEKISAFIETCSPIHKMISGNRQQNESLASIRDSMLPKLMSGEMDVSELNL